MFLLVIVVSVLWCCALDVVGYCGVVVILTVLFILLLLCVLAGVCGV